MLALLSKTFLSQCPIWDANPPATTQRQGLLQAALIGILDLLERPLPAGQRRLGGKQRLVENEFLCIQVGSQKFKVHLPGPVEPTRRSGPLQISILVQNDGPSKCRFYPWRGCLVFSFTPLPSWFF